MSKLKKGLILLVGLIVITAVYVIDQYVYSWSGLVAYKMGACESKLIKAAAPSGKDGFKKLSYPLDLAGAAAKLKTDQRYTVAPNENSLDVSRMFGDLKYTIMLENRITEGAEAIYYRYSVSCPSCKPSVYGEKCSTPDFELYKKIYWIVEDLSVGDKTKRELHSGLAVYHHNSKQAIFK